MSEAYRGMVTVANVDENMTIISAAGGALYRVKGPVMCMKNLVLSWRAPENIDDWKIEHFAPIFMIHPKTFLVIIGENLKLIFETLFSHPFSRYEGCQNFDPFIRPLGGCEKSGNKFEPLIHSSGCFEDLP